MTCSGNFAILRVTFATFGSTLSLLKKLRFCPRSASGLRNALPLLVPSQEPDRRFFRMSKTVRRCLGVAEPPAEISGAGGDRNSEVPFMIVNFGVKRSLTWSDV